MIKRKLLAIAAPALFLATAATPASASPIATMHGSVTIARAVGISISRDVLDRANISLIIAGSWGDAMSLNVPESVELTGLNGDNLSLPMASPKRKINTMLGRDIVSVSTASFSGNGAGGSPYRGAMVVLAQYN